METFDQLLNDFGLPRNDAKSTVVLESEVPAFEQTKSQKINLSLIGSLPATANALAAAHIYESRGGEPQQVSVDLSRGHNYIDPDIGMTPSINGQEIPVDVVVGNPFLHNIFLTADDRSAVISAVYVDLVYKWLTFFNCSPDEGEVRTAVKGWHSQGVLEAKSAPDLADAAAKAGLPMAIVQGEEEWAASPQGKFLAALPIVPVQRIGNAPPKPWPSTKPTRPLQGLKVLCATHAIAGPSSGRTLAEHGASVLQIMFTHGFEHNFVYDSANLGCASARLNFHKAADIEHMWALIKDADVWIDSYRDGALSKFGFDDARMHDVNPSLIISHVRCFGTGGPWANRAGFDMQGSAASGLMAYCGNGPLKPAWPPGSVINDYTTGFYGALAIQAAMLRRSKEGGGYIISPSLTGTAMSILKYFKTRGPSSQTSPNAPRQVTGDTPMGYLHTLSPLPQMSLTPPRYDPILLVPIGSSSPIFPGFGSVWDPKSVQPRQKEKLITDIGIPTMIKLAKIKQIGKESNKVRGAML